MPNTIRLDNGQVLDVLGIGEAADLLGCEIEDLEFLLQQTWLREFSCSCCGATYPLAEDVYAVLELAKKHRKMGLTELARLHYEQMQKDVQKKGKAKRSAAPSIRPNPYYDSYDSEYVEPGRAYGATARPQLSHAVQQRLRTASVRALSEKELEEIERRRTSQAAARTWPQSKYPADPLTPEELDALEMELEQRTTTPSPRQPQRQQPETTGRVVRDGRGRTLVARSFTHNVEAGTPPEPRLPNRSFWPGRK